MSFLRRLFRRLTAHALYYSGILWIIAAYKLRRRAVVLMYHRVLPPDADTFCDNGIVITPASFARNLSFLKKHFHPLSEGALAELLDSAAQLPSRGAVITFDDGWYDNFRYALPLLKSHDFPATIFVATDYVGSRECFWQERLARLTDAALRAGPDATSPLQPWPELLAAQSRIGPSKRAIREFIADLKDAPREVPTQLERRIADSLVAAGHRLPSAGDDRFMSREEIACLAPPSVVSIGGHGCSHRPFTTLDAGMIASEIQTCKTILEGLTGSPLTSIAYPNGSYDSVTIAEARRAGFKLGFTTKRGLVKGDDDPMILRRLNVHEESASTDAEFLCLILGIFHAWPKDVHAKASHARTGYR